MHRIEWLEFQTFIFDVLPFHVNNDKIIICKQFNGLGFTLLHTKNDDKLHEVEKLIHLKLFKR
jgi:hypothetical protein